MTKTMKSIILVCCVLLVAIPGMAQAKKVAVKATKQQSSKLDLYAGYSYWAPHGDVNNFTYKSINAGFTLGAAYYFNPYLGAQFEATRGEQTSNDGMRSFSGGLIARYPHMKGMTPFVHGLVGVIGLTGPNIATTQNASSFFYNPEHWGTTLTIGGGVDIPTPLFHHHLSLRLFQVDYQYVHVDFGPPQPTQGGRANLSAAHLTTGIVYSFNRVRF